MKKVLLVAALAVGLTGCQYHVGGWHQPATGSGYGTWTFDPTVNNGCNEHETEVTAEVDNQGKLCKSVLP